MNQMQSPTLADDAGYSRPLGDALTALPPLIVYWLAIKRRRWLIGGIIAGALTLGVVFTLLATPYYKATSRIQIDRQAEQVTDVKAVEAVDTGKDQEFYQTQYALLRAQSLAERVARSLNLASDDEFFEQFGRRPGASKVVGTADRQARLRQAGAILLDHLTVAPIRGSSLVDLEFESPDPQLSARVANAWVDQFVASTLDRRFASTQDARNFLEKRLAELRGKMESSERELVNYAADKGIIALSKQTGDNGRTSSQQTINQADLEALNRSLSIAMDARIQAESALRSGQGTAQRAASPGLGNLRQARAQAAAELAQLSTQFEPGYPQIQALQSKIAAFDRAIASEESRMTAALNSDYREALRRENALRAEVNALKSAAIGEQANSIQYNIYQRDVDTSRELYDGLLQRFKEIGVAGVASNNVAVVDRAQVPTKPASPNLLLNLLLALLAGVLVAMLVVIALEQTDQTVKDVSDVTNRLGLPLLGIIPAVQPSEFANAMSDPKSEIAEAYLSVQTNLSFLTDHGVPRSILFTSTQPNEGKSSSAYALAQTLARTGKRVLVIDADMRNSSLHEIAEVPNRMGLSNYLAGEEFGDNLLVPSGYPNLSLLTAGPKPPSAGELLMSNRLGALLTRAASLYDVVLIDAPPVLGIADVPLIAKAVEGIVYTIESDNPRLRTIQQSLSRLAAAQGHVFGVLITKARSGDSFAYGYGHTYGYGRERSDDAQLTGI